MRILIINREPYGSITCTTELAKYASRAHEVSYLSFDQAGFISQRQELAEAPIGVKVRTVRRDKALAIRYGRWLAGCVSEIVRGRYDIVLVVYFPGCSLLRTALAGERAVLDIRSGSVSAHPARRFLADLILRVEAAFFPYLLIIGEGLRRRIGITASTARIHSVGADPVYGTRRAFGALRLLYIGSLDAKRGIERTIIGFAEARRQLAAELELSYTIVGDGPRNELQDLRYIVRRLGLERAVHLVGYVPHNRLPQYLTTHNVGVSFVPMTKYYDQQPPTKTYEYLLAGLPVIATATSEHARIITPGNGVLIRDTAESFCDGIVRLAAVRNVFDSAEIRDSCSDHSWRCIMLTRVLPYLMEIGAKDAAPAHV